MVRLGNVIRDLRCDEIRGSPTLFGRAAAGQVRCGGSSLEGNRCSSCSDGVGRRQRRHHGASIWSGSAVWSSRLEAWESNRMRGILGSGRTSSAVTGESLLRIWHEHLRQRNGRHGRQRSSSHLVRRWHRRQKRRRGNRWRMHRSLTRRTARGRGLRVRIGLDSGLVGSLALLGHRLMLLFVPGERRAIVVYKTRQGEPLKPCGLDSTIDEGPLAGNVTGRLDAEEDATKPSRSRRSIKFKFRSLEYTGRRALGFWNGFTRGQLLAVERGRRSLVCHVGPRKGRT